MARNRIGVRCSIRTAVYRALSVGLAVSLSAPAVLAADLSAGVDAERAHPTLDLKGSIAREAEALALAQTVTPGTGKNPYLVPAIALMAGGGILAIWGFGTNDACAGLSFSCNERNSVYFGLLGAGVAAGGAALFFKGESLKDHRFGININRRSINVRMRIGR